MAELKLESGKTLTNWMEIQTELAPLKVALSQWPTGDHPELKFLLEKPALSEGEKEQVLFHLDPYFQKLKTEQSYQTRDLIVLHSEVPQLDELLQKFISCHTHDDDEVRYIIDGEGVFGFVRPDGSQVALKVEAGEYINVPRDTEHWFHLTDSKRIKAVRYFTNTEGWTPRYTETERRL